MIYVNCILIKLGGGSSPLKKEIGKLEESNLF